MKKILMIHTTYRLTGGEDVAFNNEVKVLKNNFNVEVMKFSNKNIPNIFKQFIYFLTNNNKDSQKVEKLVKFKPDIVYVTTHGLASLEFLKS